MKRSKPAKKRAKPRLLSGGNPQIPKGDGNAPVKAWVSAVPGWKGRVARRLDALIVRGAPKVHKAIKWNSPFYGSEFGGWFICLHCFTNYIKVTFFYGVSLDPMPPRPSKHKTVRYLDVREDDVLDEKQFLSWVRQAAKLPGWIM